MSHLIGIVSSTPAIGMVVFLSGLSLALCGYLGHTRPLKSGFKAIGVFLLILLACGLMLYSVRTGQAHDFIKIFLAPMTGLLGLFAPLTVLWLHLRRANIKLTATRTISKWLRPLVFSIGVLLVLLSLPGVLRYMAWFI